MALENRTDNKSRLLARLVRELVTAQSFETLADLREALKCRCARLRIRWTNDEINDACRLVASNAALVVTQPTVVVPAPEEPPITPRQASDVLAMVRERLRQPTEFRAIPGVRQLSDDEIRRRQWEADKANAMRAIQEQMLDAARRCDVLESEDPS